MKAWCCLLVLLPVLLAANPVRADRAQGGVAEAYPMADELVVFKAERRLELRRGGEVLRSFPIALGGSPEGHKAQEGDQRTPEGRYLIEGRNPNSAFFLALRVSYPNATDAERARARGVSPGNNIMIHGLPNEPEHPSRQYLQADWTDGCIAVSNAAMIDIWLSVEDGTPITILP
ncbi:L,D-transpeptidase family protein [Thioalkalivibrio sp. XN8]|uniref:L,D-transpeptidase family protein n=1 Tax=Thioalkalivibrio sp. XN8 TaxID=2712863 RepID=UPI0013EC5405|nr:L,D-transpeptidase family protein [Thioalkalivibrio sp. XN8]NGP52783.1 L,D-transpeptidase family protein [Thioalkalivibrio sp. XN8]